MRLFYFQRLNSRSRKINALDHTLMLKVKNFVNKWDMIFFNKHFFKRKYCLIPYEMNVRHIMLKILKFFHVITFLVGTVAGISFLSQNKYYFSGNYWFFIRPILKFVYQEKTRNVKNYVFYFYQK